jgi:hypothetical protein
MAFSVSVSKTIDGTFTGGDFEVSSMTASKVSIVGGLSINDANDNVRIGTEAAYFLTNGTNNIAIGKRAAYYLSTGADNLCIGQQAGYLVNTGTYNICMGNQAGYQCRGQENICFGVHSGYTLKDAIRNVCIGYRAAELLYHDDTLAGHVGTTKSYYNVILGNEAASHSAVLERCVFLGYRAGYKCNANEAVDQGLDNVFIGTEAGAWNKGRYCVNIGTRAAQCAGTSPNGLYLTEDVVIGYEACMSMTTSSGGLPGCNVVIGGNALRVADDVGDTVAIGRNVGVDMKGSYGDVLIGNNVYCGDPSATSEGNVVIGQQSMVDVDIWTGYNCVLGFEALKKAAVNPALGAEYNVILGSETCNKGITDNFNNNVVIGGYAGQKLKGGTGNIFIGCAAGNYLVAGTHNNTLIIANSDTADDVILSGTFVNPGTHSMTVHGDLTVNGILTMGGGSAMTSVALQDSTGPPFHYINLTAPALVPATYTVTFPAAVGATNSLLQATDAAGTLAWTTGPTLSQVVFDASGTAFNMTMKAADALSEDYTLAWPDTKGANGNVLITDAAGSLYWASQLGNIAPLTLLKAITLESTGTLVLDDDDAKEYVALQAPAAVSSSYTLTLPSDVGATNSILQATNGTGTLGWTTGPTFSQVVFDASGTAFNMTMKAADALSENYTLAWPDTKGANGNVLITDAAGSLYWASQLGNISPLTLLKAITLESTGALQLDDDDAKEYVALQAPAAVSASYTLTLPTAVNSLAYSFLGTTDTSGALDWIPDAYRNVRIGTTAAFTGPGNATDNILIGYESGKTISTGDGNVCMGSQAGKNITTALGYVCIGTGTASTGLSPLTGNGAGICIGGQAGYVLEGTAEYGVLIGAQAGLAMTTPCRNVAIGYRASVTTTTGTQNVCIGYEANTAAATTNSAVAIGLSSVAGLSAVAIGNGAIAGSGSDYSIAIGTDVATGILAENICMGHTTGKNLSAVSGNIIVGTNACSTGATLITVGNGSAGNNTVIGYNAAPVAAGAFQYNTIVGAAAAAAITSAQKTVIIGWNAGIGLTSGAGNVMVGSAAGNKITTGAANVCIGTETLANGANPITANDNVCIGYRAGYVIEGVGAGNVCVGSLAGLACKTGSTNVCIGYRAGQAITTGSNNTCIGVYAGDEITTGSSQVVIGNDHTVAAALNETTCVGYKNTVTGTEAVGVGRLCTASGSYAVVIGDGATGSNAQSIAIGRVAVSSGESGVAIGYDSQATLQFSVSVGPGIKDTLDTNVAGVRIGHSGYYWVGKYGTATWAQASDARLKSHIRDYPVEAVTVIDKLRPCIFKMRGLHQEIVESNPDTGGFIAQEVEQAMRECGVDLPCVVETDGALENDPDPLRRMDRSMLIPALVLALQDARKRIAALEAALLAH